MTAWLKQNGAKRLRKSCTDKNCEVVRMINVPTGVSTDYVESKIKMTESAFPGMFDDARVTAEEPSLPNSPNNNKRIFYKIANASRKAETVKKERKDHFLSDQRNNGREKTKGRFHTDMSIPLSVPHFADSEIKHDDNTYDSLSRILYNSQTGKTVCITKNGKIVEPIFEGEKIVDMKLKESGTVYDLESILQKIKIVEKLSKEFVDMSVKSGLDTSDYCSSVNTLHELITSKSSYTNVNMAAKHVQTEIQKLKDSSLQYELYAYVTKIENNLKKFSGT